MANIITQVRLTVDIARRLNVYNPARIVYIFKTVNTFVQ